MALRSRNKVSAEFNMSSMTDIVFLLLIFFMLTSSFVTPNILKVELPTSKIPTQVVESISVGISEDLRYSINNRIVAKSELKSELAKELSGIPEDERAVNLHADKNIKLEDFVFVATIATELNARINLKTKPE